MSPRMLRRKEVETRKEFFKARPNPLGNLHERMTAVMHLAEEVGLDKEVRFHDLLNAIYDLQTEVSYTTPAKPPFGRRFSGGDKGDRRFVDKSV